MLRVLDQEKERRAMTVNRAGTPIAMPDSRSSEQQVSETPRHLVRRSEERPSASVLGTLRQIDCLGKVVRLRVSSNQKQVLLAIRDKENVAIKGSEMGAVDLTCGPQKARLVTIEYESHADAVLGTVGDVRSIEFQ